MNTTLNQQRSFNLFTVAGIIIALVVVAISAIITPTTATQTAISNASQNITEKTSNIALAPLSGDAFPQYRQSEWHSDAVTNVSGLDNYHQSEWTLIPPQAGWMAYQLSERTLSPIMSVDLSSYHLSERTMIEVASVNIFAEYFASERTQVDPLAGLATYFESERTITPVLFTKFQLSEWFGQ